MGYLAARLAAEQPTAQERDALVEALKTAVLGRCQPCSIYLFGSSLGSAFTNASDIDLAVIFEDQGRLEEARTRLFSAPSLIPAPYDLLLYEQSEFERRAERGGICQVIKETGKKLHDQRSEV